MNTSKYTPSPQVVKTTLLAEAEALIAELLEWQTTHPESDFDQMEQLVQRLRRRFGQALVEKLLELQAERRPVHAPVCPDCQQQMQYKDMHGLTFESLLGVVHVQRGYYYCAPCRQGGCPLDTQLRLAGKHWSARVAREVTWLNGHTQTYGESVAILEELTDARPSKSSSWRLVQTYGAQIGAEFAAEEEQLHAQAREWSTPGGLPVAEYRLGVATDGGMLFILGEGWKELKAGCVFAVTPETRRAARTGELETFGHATQLSYTAHLGGAVRVGWQLWTEAHRRGWQQAAAGLVVGAGAPWIWNLRDEHFPATEMVVDWYHAVEHLGQVKQRLYPNGGTAASRWYNTQETALYQGHADRVAQAIRELVTTHPEVSAEETQAADYFQRNQRRMQYQRLREAGWPIGSGMIESGVKRFKARFDGAGMRWSRAGAENLLPVRAAVLSGPARFNDLWQRAYAAA